MLAAAVLAKIWPLAVAPSLLVWKRRRALLWFLSSLVLGTVSWIVWAGFDGPIQVVTLRRAHGWQIESLVASLIRVLSPGRVIHEVGADRVGSSPLWARGLLLAAAVSLLAMTWRMAAGRPDLAESVAAAASVATLLVFSPILSPQYLVWQLPWAAIAISRGELLQPELIGVASLLTAVLIYD